MIQKLRQSTWAIPLLLAAATLTGLVLALVAEGAWDGFAWVLVASPTVVACLGYTKKSS